jgi:hypothetical protein
MMRRRDYSSHGKLALFLIRHGVLVDTTSPASPASTREFRWAVVGTLAVGGIFAYLGLNTLLFGNGFGADPLKYLASLVATMFAFVCLVLVGYGTVRRRRMRRAADHTN